MLAMERYSQEENIFIKYGGFQWVGFHISQPVRFQLYVRAKFILKIDFKTSIEIAYMTVHKETIVWEAKRNT